MRRYWGQQKPPLGVPANKGHILCPSSGLWLMNEGTGNIVQDLSGNGNVGTLAGGPVWEGGKFGSAIKFDGSDDVLDFPTITSIPAGPVSFVGWVKVTSTAWNSCTQWSFGVTNGLQWRYEKDYTQSAGGPTTHQVKIYVNWGVVILLSDGNCQHDVWEHIVITRDSANLWTMYINAVAQADTETKAGAITTTEAQYGQSFVNSAFGVSEADNLSIYWGHCLSPSEIQQLYREPFCGYRWESVIELASYVAAAGGSSVAKIMQQMNQFNGGQAA